MSDRLRDLIDLVLGSLDEPGASGPELARQAGFSRDHLDRLLAAATGESPVALRRRLLLERAAWQLRAGGAGMAEVALAAGYGSPEAFSRAFSRAYGMPPGSFAASGAPVQAEAPNGIHFHPPAGLLIPGDRRPGEVMGDLSERMVRHHLDRCRELLDAAEGLSEEQLSRPLRPGFVVLGFEGEEPSALAMAERTVYTLEVWVASIDGRELPPARQGDRPARFEAAARDFVRLARSIRDRSAWDDAFVDALCEPPQSFTYGGVTSHILTFGAIRREALASVLAELGVEGLASPDPIDWEMRVGLGPG